MHSFVRAVTLLCISRETSIFLNITDKKNRTEDSQTFPQLLNNEACYLHNGIPE